jgi:GT2 family glycosyltransferase
VTAAPTQAPVTVAVVSSGTRDLLDACLASLEGDVASGLAEVWVVDNASSDGSAAMVSQRFPWVRLLALERNLGYGRAVNLVAERSRGEWIVAANADVAVAPGALGELLAAGRSDPGAGAASPLLRLPDGTPQHSAYPFPTVPFTLAFNLGAHRLSSRLGERLCLEGCWSPHVARPVPWAIAAFLAVRRTAFEQIGGFDPGQWLFAEDLDLGWRLHRAGWRTLHVPAAEVRHEGGAATVAAFGAARTARWQDATYAWMLVRRGGPRARLVAAINVAGALARCALFAALAPLCRERWRAAREANRQWSRLHARGLRPRAELLGRR